MTFWLFLMTSRTGMSVISARYPTRGATTARVASRVRTPSTTVPVVTLQQQQLLIIITRKLSPGKEDSSVSVNKMAFDIMDNLTTEERNIINKLRYNRK